MSTTNYHFLSSSSSSKPSSTYIPLHKTQLPPQLHKYPSSINQKSHHHKHKHLFIIISLSLIPFLLYFLSLYNSLHILPSSSFGLIIDISNSHSQILVFRSLNEVSGNPISGESSESFWVDVGMFNFSKDPGFVGPSVLKLVGFAKEKVPSFEWKETEVMVFISGDFVGGSGGGGGDSVGNEEREKVLEMCRKVLGSSGFLFRDEWASVLKDEDQSFYSWLAINCAFGYLGSIPEKTVGLVSLGRSAMQVSFASPETPSHSSRVIRLAGVPYNHCTESLQQFSQDAVWKLLHERKTQDLMSSSLNSKRPIPNPCYPKGYELISKASGEKFVHFHGAGNFSTCKSELTMLLNERKAKCTRAPCEIVPSIFSELEYKPHPQQRFFVSSQHQGLVSKASIPDLESVARHFCEDDWETLKRQHNTDESDLSRSCFSHAFVVILLSNGFGISLDDKRVEVAAGSTPVDWRLGAYISQTIMEPSDDITEHHDHDTHIVENESVTFLFLVAVLIVSVLLATFSVMKLRKPQLKTIYDLEQGRYIVRRVPR